GSAGGLAGGAKSRPARMNSAVRSMSRPSDTRGHASVSPRAARLLPGKEGEPGFGRSKRLYRTPSVSEWAGVYSRTQVASTATRRQGAAFQPGPLANTRGSVVGSLPSIQVHRKGVRAHTPRS